MITTMEMHFQHLEGPKELYLAVVRWYFFQKVSDFQSLDVFAKRFIINIWWGPKNVSGLSTAKTETCW